MKPQRNEQRSSPETQLSVVFISRNIFFISRIVQYKTRLLMTILYKHELLRSGWTTVQTFMAGNHAITTHSRCTYMALWLCTSCHLLRWHFACSQIGQTCANSNCSRWLHCKTLQVVPILYEVSLFWTPLQHFVISCGHTCILQ